MSDWDFTHTLGSDLSGHNPNETWIMTLREMTSMSRLIICQICSTTSQASWNKNFFETLRKIANLF